MNTCKYCAGITYGPDSHGICRAQSRKKPQTRIEWTGNIQVHHPKKSEAAA